MPSTRSPEPFRLDDERRALRVLEQEPVTLGELRHALAARMPGRRPVRAADRLCKAGEAALAAGKYAITDKGRARLAEAPPKLPVLPEPFTPCAGFACSRLGTSLTVEQCVGRYGTRGEDACGRGEDGAQSRQGCPIGAEAQRRLAGYLAGDERKARAA